jgi:hypothetical protein
VISGSNPKRSSYRTVEIEVEIEDYYIPSIRSKIPSTVFPCSLTIRKEEAAYGGRVNGWISEWHPVLIQKTAFNPFPDARWRGMPCKA